MNTLDWVKAVLIRDLQTLDKELQSYSNESLIWEKPDGCKNSAGNLALHLIGNIRHFIGMGLGGSDYKRNRPEEFELSNIPVPELTKLINLAIDEVGIAFDKLADTDLSLPYPKTVLDLPISTGQFLVHLVTHFGYHLGQIDYHRRIVTGNSEGVGAQAIPIEKN